VKIRNVVTVSIVAKNLSQFGLCEFFFLKLINNFLLWKILRIGLTTAGIIIVLGIQYYKQRQYAKNRYPPLNTPSRNLAPPGSSAVIRRQNDKTHITVTQQQQQQPSPRISPTPTDGFLRVNDGRKERPVTAVSTGTMSKYNCEIRSNYVRNVTELIKVISVPIYYLGFI